MPHKAAVATASKRLFEYVDGLSLAIYIVTLQFPDSDGYFLCLEIYSDFSRAIIQVRVLWADSRSEW